MSAKHTPGPWTDKSVDGSQWGIYDATGLSVAQAQQIRPKHVDIMQSERTANARLIAAAPDLLKALWVCAEHNALYFSENHNTVIQARAAIEKATGETP